MDLPIAASQKAVAGSDGTGAHAGPVAHSNTRERQMPLTILPVFIQAGQSLSDPVDCSAGPIIKITQPGAWTIDAPTGGPAALTFQTSSDGIMFNDVFDPAGNELSYVVIAGTGVIGMRLTTGWV